MITEYVYDVSKDFSLSMNKNKEKEINNIITQIINKSSIIAYLREKETQLVADLDDPEIKELLKKGMEIIPGRDGKPLAQLRHPDSKQFSKRIPLKEIDVGPSIAEQLNRHSINSQIQNITAQLEVIQSSVNDLIIGQHNDRIALARNAHSLLLTSEHIENSDLKKETQKEAITMSGEAFYKISETLIYNVESLRNNKSFSFLTMSNNKKIEISNNLYMQLEALIYTGLIRSYSYYKLDEPKATAISFGEINKLTGDLFDETIRESLHSWMDFDERIGNFWVDGFPQLKNKLDRNLNVLNNSLQDYQKLEGSEFINYIE